jgi:MFS superfamily sulfate permease-like transporter
MALVPRLVRGVPSGLVALVLGLAAAALFSLEAHGVRLMGAVATGLPDPGIPPLLGEDPDALWAAAMGIVLVVFAEAIGAGRTLAARHDYDVDANRELLALGAANLASGLFQGITVGGGLSGSAANDAAGARTPLATLVTSGVVVLTLLFLLPLFAGLPDAVLGAIVVVAVLPLLDVKEMHRYAGLPQALLPHLTALFGVLVLGVLGGMILAVVLTFVLLVRDLARPRISMLGRVPGSRTVVALDHHEEARPIPGLVILRPEGRLFYGNAERIRERLLAVARAEPRPRQVLLNLEATPSLGVTANDMLDRAAQDLGRLGVEMALTRVHDDVLGYMRLSGLLARLGESRVTVSLTDAVDRFLHAHPDAAPAG